MRHIWKLTLIKHRRKKHIIWLLASLVVLVAIAPFLNSISLWQGQVVNQSLQHTVVELVGVLFLWYFWASSLSDLSTTKTLQLLRAKKKEPLNTLIGLWTGLYTIYSVFVLSAGVIFSTYYADISLMISYVNLLASGAILLTLVFVLSFFTNSYTALLGSMIFYITSYSINYIVFSIPVTSEDSLSSHALHIVKHIFPRFDVLYSTTWEARVRALGANILYYIAISILMIRVFLRRSH